MIKTFGLILFFIITFFIVYEFSKEKQKTPFVEIKKTMCFGTCPVYDATIFDDGSVWFEGKYYVKHIGHMKFKLTDGDMLDIKNAIANADFFNLEDEYDGEVTDLPSTYLTVYEDSKAKQVRARYNIPEKLSSLINVVHNKIIKYVG